jgi:hypothetical protein
VAHGTKHYLNDPFVAHARQTGAAENLVRCTLDGIGGYRNPVIRLLAADGLLRSEADLKDARRTAVLDLRAMGWTWERIGSLLSTTRQHAWQMGHAK